MLRKLRIILAAISFTLVTLLFLDFTGAVHSWFGWMAKVQALPAILALNLGIIIALVVLTLLFGRVYCSVICPLGIMQDIISFFRKKRNKYGYKKPITWLRVTFLVLFVIVLIAGVGGVVTLLEPYSTFGAIASNLFAPLYGLGNNLLAMIAEKADSYAFYSTEVYIRSIPVFIFAAVMFVIIFILAWKGGRTYCNTVCPVGTVLGTISKFSLFKPSFDLDKCNGCKLCARNCRANCINPEEHKIDFSRCVACMDCLNNCHQGAISYKLAVGKKHQNAERTDNQNNKGRRAFVSASAIIGIAAVANSQEQQRMDGGLAVILDKKVPAREHKIVPPGSISIKNMENHCVGCQLCIMQCPNKVLIPRTDLMGFMKPQMTFEKGYCRPECTKCSEVCPAGAIKPLDVAEKSSTQIGHAVVILDNCIAAKDGVSCGNCARHCPAGAIKLVRTNPDDNTSPRIPTVNTERCIGCGSCEFHCPSRPFGAIYIEGHDVHKTI